MRAFLLLVPALALLGVSLGGCYLSHERPGRFDAGADASVPRDTPILLPDIPPSARCERLVIAHTASLDGPAIGSVTPRVASLGDGRVAVAYVHTDGDPTAVYVEIRDAALRPTGAPTLVARDSFSWAEVVHDGEGIWVAYSRSGGTSALHTLDGARSAVMLEHPSILLDVPGGFLWTTFEMRDGNALVSAMVSRDGTLLSMPSRIELGRYGSGHHGTTNAFGRILGYPREDGRGVRHGFVRRIDEAGALGIEQRVGDGDITQVWPLSVRSERASLFVVANGDALHIERREWERLEVLDAIIAPPIEGPFVASLARPNYLVIARLADGRLAADVYDDETFALIETLEAPMPGTVGVGTSVTQASDGIVIAAGLSSGGETFPWLARIQCAD